MTTTATPQWKPDGRPLYAYKWHDKDYERLKEEVRAEMPRALRDTEAYCFAAKFCIYAAETFRRRHEGGPWAWETIFAEIGYTTPDYPLIYVWVERGLRHFQRPLLRSRRGDRQFLVTLACEGGLPLRLLHQENAPLNRYFRELLTAYHRERRTSGGDAKEMARQVAVRYLPASLRHEVVFQLSGELIQSVVKLQEQVADAADPIASLDRIQLQWRDKLPLPVEDDIVEALLRNLVDQARNLAQTERQRWRWRCYLVRQGEGWNIEQHLELPSTVTGSSLHAWSGWSGPPARLRVLLQTTDGMEVIALLTRLQETGEQTLYQCEGLRRNGVRLIGNTAVAGARLLLSKGNEEVELPMVGGQELGPLPWAFVERGAQWEMCGEGSVRSRDTSMRVLALDDGHCMAVDGACELLGRAAKLQRSLYQITGATEWQHPELGTCQLRCASQEASEENFLVGGNRLSSVFNLKPPFLGMPSLYAVGRDEVQRRVHGGTLEWRPLHAPESAWRMDAAACAGRVWMRYRDASGALRFRRQVEVVPATTRIEMVRVGASAEKAGIIRLTGLSAVRVIVSEEAGCQFRTRVVDDGVEVDCFAQVSLPVTQFRADLQWLAGRSLTLVLPFPRQGAAFVRAGQVLPPMERVALGRLAAIQAVVRTPTGGGRFYLEGRLRTRTARRGGGELQESLRAVSNAPIQFALHCLQERLASRLAMTGDLDAVVILEIIDCEGQVLAQLEVAQFDVALEPDREQNRVVLPLASLERLSNDWQERITVKMLPLWNPSTMVTDLERDGAAIAWQVPEALEPGPWWVLGSDGDWARFRPLLWVVQGEKVMTEAGDLMQAMHEPDHKTRQARLQALVHALAADAEHPDWPNLFDCLRLTRTYPASAIDLFPHLVRVPEAMVLTLLRSADEEFDLVWSLAEQLPFSWHLVPVTGWLLAAKRYFYALRAGLADHDPDGAWLSGMFREFRQRVTSRQPFFKSVCDWIGEQLFPGQQLENSELAMARHHESVLTVLLREQEQALQARHDAEERYPDGPQVMERIRQPNFPAPFRYARFSYPYRPVRCAPFVAAQISLDAQDSPEELLFELRQLRDFDQDWFDHAFALALCLGLARRPVAIEGTHS
ncbi:hypothetical protein NKDENANG_03821 [Candidatus Entotheonellaceae bacterium PAL068K]